MVLGETAAINSRMLSASQLYRVSMLNLHLTIAIRGGSKALDPARDKGFRRMARSSSRLGGLDRAQVQPPKVEDLTGSTSLLRPG